MSLTLTALKVYHSGIRHKPEGSVNRSRVAATIHHEVTRDGCTGEAWLKVPARSTDYHAKLKDHSREAMMPTDAYH
jgi:hypothetical protein